MKCSITRNLLMAAFTTAIFVSTAWGAPVEPVPEPIWRDLRPGHIRTWCGFPDANSSHGQVNGILDPSDQLIGSSKD